MTEFTTAQFTAAQIEEPRQHPRAGDSGVVARQPDLPAVVVVQQRNYPRAAVLLPLVAKGLLVTETQPGEGLAFAVSNLQPELVIIAASPDTRAPAVVGEAAGLSGARCLALLSKSDRALTIECLQAGADIVTRESDGDELLEAQLAAIVRRAAVEHPSAAPHFITIGDLTINLDRHQAMVRGKAIPLTPTEFRIVAMLALNAGRIVTPAQLASEILDESPGDLEARGFAKVHVARVRKKLGQAGVDPAVIVNVRGVGYMLEEQTRVAGDPGTGQ